MLSDLRLRIYKSPCHQAPATKSKKARMEKSKRAFGVWGTWAEVQASVGAIGAGILRLLLQQQRPPNSGITDRTA